MLGNYVRFIELFSRLSPYELNHLSEILLCKIELLAEGKMLCKTTGLTLTEQDLKFAVTESMRDILVQLRKLEIDQQQIQLAQTISQIFMSDKVAA
jgi:hypothetical protein